jgi:ubiquitin C-terminal hydrolase
MYSDDRLIIGLQNEDSASCYLNSVLQILFNIDPLNNFISKTKSISFNNEGKILNVYKGILDLLISDDGKIVDDDNVITSSTIKKSLEYSLPICKGEFQQDAHEVLIGILNIFHAGFDIQQMIAEDICGQILFPVPLDKIKYYAETCWKNENKKEKYSIITNLFKGQIRSKITCQNCLTETNSFCCINNFSLPLPSYNVETTTLEECIEEYCEIEYLGGNNKYFCDRCKSYEEAFKETSIWKLPRFLIFHFNRFIHNFEENTIIKNDTDIIYPLTNFKFNKCSAPYNDIEYKLNSIICHHGHTIESGHYTSDVLKDGIWYNLNDETIEVDPAYKSTPYILVYEVK